jgi:NADPH-dependent 2,4-dienoyl-CoA reductase/sulfur reductase-like enzyme
MTRSDPDVLIVGAGPAGMSAATRARHYGLDVLVVDEQAEPGGQIWRGIERVGRTPRAGILGADYTSGLDVVARFRKNGADFGAETTLWHIEDGPVAFLRSKDGTRRVCPGAVVLATGAQERPVPFDGWTLPGVMSVGAGQILLKSSGQVPDGPVWVAGTGPLAYLFTVQLLAAGVEISGFLDTRPKGRVVGNSSLALAAVLGQPADIVKGLTWLVRLRRQGRYVADVRQIVADGRGHLERITYQAGNRKRVSVPAQHLFVHEGIVPGIHPTMALDCAHHWTDMQDSFAPTVDPWGETSSPRVFAAGDLAGIAGAKAACLRGDLAAIGIAQRLGRIGCAEARQEARPDRKRLALATSARPFLDRVYRPRPNALLPGDSAMACRCEEVTVGEIRALCRTGRGDPNRIKAFSRAGMGACQGRMCNYVVASVLADETGIPPSAIGLYRVRPPFKPVTLEELARLQMPEAEP